MIKEITSRDNPLYKELLHLKKGDGEKGLFLAEGEDLYREARKEGALRTLILPFGSAFPKDFENIVLLKPMPKGLARESCISTGYRIRAISGPSSARPWPFPMTGSPFQTTVCLFIIVR